MMAFVGTFVCVHKEESWTHRIKHLKSECREQGTVGERSRSRRAIRPGLSKLRTNAFASEHNLPPDAYWDQDSEQIHKKRKINAASKSKYCSLARVRGKNRARMEKHQQHTNQDWNRGEKERPFTSPLAQTKQSTRTSDAQQAKQHRKNYINDVERRVQKMKSRGGPINAHKFLRQTIPINIGLQKKQRHKQSEYASEEFDNRSRHGPK